MIRKEEKALAKKWAKENPEEVRQFRSDLRQRTREHSVEFYIQRRGISREESEAIVKDIAARHREWKRSANAKVDADVVLRNIADRYDYWRNVYEGKSKHEPVITASDFVWPYLDDAKDSRAPVLRAHVQRILDRLVEDGKLTTSEAMKNGRPCKAYEPVRSTND